MEYEISGGNLPYVKCRLSAGESIQCEAGAMAWMDDCFEMETQGGGIGKMFGRMFSGESMFRNRYIARYDGEIAFASCFPGTIQAFTLRPGQELIAQKNAYLAIEAGVDMSVYFQKRFGSGFFGGEGFIMQRFTGSGTVFLEIDGSAETYTLAPGERKIVSTGNLLAMDGSCSMDVRSVGGLKNTLFGGEGFFNTVINGPGRIVLQSMPIQATANALYRYMPIPSSSSGSSSK